MAQPDRTVSEIFGELDQNQSTDLDTYVKNLMHKTPSKTNAEVIVSSVTSPGSPQDFADSIDLSLGNTPARNPAPATHVNDPVVLEDDDDLEALVMQHIQQQHQAAPSQPAPQPSVVPIPAPTVSKGEVEALTAELTHAKSEVEQLREALRRAQIECNAVKQKYMETRNEAMDLKAEAQRAAQDEDRLTSKLQNLISSLEKEQAERKRDAEKFQTALKEANKRSEETITELTKKLQAVPPAGASPLPKAPTADATPKPKRLEFSSPANQQGTPLLFSARRLASEDPSSPPPVFTTLTEKVKRLVAAEAAHRKAVETAEAASLISLLQMVLPHMMQLASFAWAVARLQHGNDLINKVMQATIPEVSADPDAARWDRMFRVRLDLLEESVEEKVGTLIAAASHAIATAPSPLPQLRVSGDSGIDVGIGSGMMIARPGHRRTMSGGSCASGGSFASPPSSAPASFKEPGRARGSSTGSNAAPPPIKPPANPLTDRPPAQKQLLTVGKFAATTVIGSQQPSVRYDQITAESKNWKLQDYSDYCDFAATNIFVVGPPMAGKSSLVHCLTHKTPSFFKSVPKVDPSTLVTSAIVHRFGKDCKLPSAPVPLGGFEDQDVDVKGIMRKGGSTIGPSAAVNITDLPSHILSCSKSLPSRGALYVVTYDLTLNVTATRKAIARTVRHILASCASTALSLQQLSLGNASVETVIVPSRVSFVLVGTHKDKLPRSANDEISVQSSLREQRDWLLRFFSSLESEALTAQSHQQPQSSDSLASLNLDAPFSLKTETKSVRRPVPRVAPVLVDCYATSCEDWTVVGERPRAATNFPELIWELFCYGTIHSPTAPQHMASTILRQFSTKLLTQDEPVTPSGNVLRSSTPPLPVAEREKFFKLMRREVAKCASISILSDYNSEKPTPLAAELTMEQTFTRLAATFAEQRQAVHTEMGPGPPKPVVPAGVKPNADLNTAIYEDLVMANQASVVNFGLCRTTTSFGGTVSKSMESAAKYLGVTVSFGLVTLLTSLQRWTTFAGCVIDGEVLRRLLTQHLHMGSSIVKAVSAAAAQVAEFIPLDCGDVGQMLEQFSSECTVALCNAVAAVLRARGLVSVIPSILKDNCSLALLGQTFKNHLLSVLLLPAGIATSGGGYSFLEMKEHEAINAPLWNRHAANNGRWVNDEFPKMLIRAVNEVSDSIAEEIQTGRVLHPPSAASSALRMAFEMYGAGLITLKLLEALVPHANLNLLNGDCFQLVAEVLQLTRHLPTSFVDSHNVRLPSGRKALCSHNVDFIAPMSARPIDPRVGNYLAFALTITADKDKLVTGTITVVGAPAGLFSSFILEVVEQWCHSLTDMCMWADAFIATVNSAYTCFLLADDSSSEGLTLKIVCASLGAGTASSGNVLSSAASKIPRTCSVDSLATSQGGSEAAHLANNVKDCLSLFSNVVNLATIASAPYRSNYLGVTAACNEGGQPVKPWEQLSALAREMLAGLPRPLIDKAGNCLRLMFERTTNELSLGPLLTILLHTEGNLRLA